MTPILVFWWWDDALTAADTRARIEGRRYAVRLGTRGLWEVRA